MLPFNHSHFRSPKFQNNNFEIVSGVSPFAHGIFPKASASFNHSCRPNALPVYKFDDEGLRQDIIAISIIAPKEEASCSYGGRSGSSQKQISITYLDPATHFPLRQAALREIYGFVCSCSLCQWQSSLSKEDQELPASEADRARLSQELMKVDAMVPHEHDTQMATADLWA